MARRRRREPETASIRAVTHDGRGIAALEGKTVFVAGALEGEVVRFQRRAWSRIVEYSAVVAVVSCNTSASSNSVRSSRRY
jgi:23S rRNA (uracil1939-C5)-methyltransferase